ncbi:ABC transporter substrate-binding protein [Acrocarpospora pleiomorpha]|uniref:ABC transporter substrate-binding protein n=3 Tax=Acrocarpospora pleiomorpha TaxID=90975 RepID=A0A5M3XPP9_9ACTN|nr:ABC transporter substrate-binding protein [Acrocarpospora pleiomorpha]
MRWGVAACLLMTLTACGNGVSKKQEPGAQAVRLKSCALPLQVTSSPRRAVAMEQNATEIMLTLGLGGQMVGTAYQTDPVLPELKEAYARVPVLAKQYPGREALLSSRPDFVYSMRASAYAPEAAGPRDGLAKLGVPAYLSSNDCEDPALIPPSAEIEALYTEIEEIARIFGVQDRGQTVVAELRRRLEEAKRSAPANLDASVMWYYSGTKTPIIAGDTGLPGTFSELLKVRNAFADISRQWAEGSWEEIATRDPDVIVLADLTRGGDGDSAQAKKDFLRNDPVASQLTAVKENRFIVVPASSLDPSIRSVSAIEQVGQGLARLYG